MNHTLYLSDKKPVCEDPERLGNDFVMNSTYPVCHDCSALLFAHNRKASVEDELAHIHNKRLHEDPLAPARGCMNGVLISSVFWILLIAGIYLYFFRG